MIRTGYSDEEYARVRPYLLAAFDASPAVFTEAEMLDKLRSGDWLLVTTDNAACVLEFFEEDGEKAANILLIGGKIGGSLREIMAAMEAVCSALRQMNFAYLCGSPRPEFAKYLLRKGFVEVRRELRLRLN